MSRIELTSEIEEKCCVARGVKGQPAPIPQEGLWTKVKEIKDYARNEMSTFWDEYLRIDKPHIYKVDLSDKLSLLKNQMLSEIRKGTQK